MTITRTLEKSIEFEKTKFMLTQTKLLLIESNAHLEKMIGALAELLDREDNRDVDTAEEFVAAVKFMNEHAGMTFKARQMQEYIEQENNKLTPQ